MNFSAASMFADSTGRFFLYLQFLKIEVNKSAGKSRQRNFED